MLPFALAWQHTTISRKEKRRMDSFVSYIYGEGDFLMILCRILVFVFALQFVTGIAYIIRGGVNGCS